MGNVVESYGRTLAKQQLAESRQWLRRAKGIDLKRPAWSGMDHCDQPVDGRGSCCDATTDHRHCECGVSIDLEHGYCDDCMAAFLRGAAMSDHQSAVQRARRLAWLERFHFIKFDRGGIHVHLG